MALGRFRRDSHHRAAEHQIGFIQFHSSPNIDMNSLKSTSAIAGKVTNAFSSPMDSTPIGLSVGSAIHSPECAKR